MRAFSFSNKKNERADFMAWVARAEARARGDMRLTKALADLREEIRSRPWRTERVEVIAEMLRQLITLHESQAEHDKAVARGMKPLPFYEA